MKELLTLADWISNKPRVWTSEQLDLIAHELEDTVAAIFAGSSDPLLEVVLSVSNPGNCTLIGRVEKVSISDAALCNGFAGHVRELDEMYIAGLGHFGCVVVPAVFALAQTRQLAVYDVLDALLVGAEVMGRFGLALDRPHVAQGWHGTATIGVFAAAAACARLLKVTPEVSAQALVLSASMCCGMVSQFGSPAKPLQAGLAAKSGCTAALLAAAGMTGNLDALVAKNGFSQLYSQQRTPKWEALASHSETLLIQEHGLVFKAYPNCMSAHRCIDAFKTIRKNNDFDWRDIQSIEARVGQVNLVNLRFDRPNSIQQAQFSMHFALSCVALFGTVSLEHFNDGMLQNEQVQLLLPKITIANNRDAQDATQDTIESIRPHRVTVTLNNGAVFSETVQYAKGDSRFNPFTLSERDAKLYQCFGSFPTAKVELIKSICRSGWEQPINSLAAHLTP